MLKSFVHWAHHLTLLYEGTVFKFEITESLPSDNPSARLDVDAPTAIGRITCWESGDYVAEVLDVATARNLYSSHGAIRPDFTELFAGFFQVLGNPDGSGMRSTKTP